MSARRDLDGLDQTSSWDGVRAVVAGFGVSGFAAADNLNHLGATVTALDESATGKEEKAELNEWATKAKAKEEENLKNRTKTKAKKKRKERKTKEEKEEKKRKAREEKAEKKDKVE